MLTVEFQNTLTDNLNNDIQQQLQNYNYECQIREKIKQFQIERLGEKRMMDIVSQSLVQAERKAKFRKRKEMR